METEESSSFTALEEQPESSLPDSSLLKAPNDITTDLADWCSLYICSSLEIDIANIGFERFFFVLKDGALRYYKDDKRVVEEGNIPLDDLSVQICSETKYGKKFCFELTPPSADSAYVIMTENTTKLTDWMSGIRRCLIKIRRAKENEAKQKEEDVKSVQGETSEAPQQQLGLATPNLEQNERYNIYSQWLEEAKMSEKEANGTLKRNLLDDTPVQERHICCGKIRWNSNGELVKCDCCCCLLM